MTWDEVCADRSLRDLPYKIETNGVGQIVMTPARNPQGIVRGRIMGLLGQLLPGGMPAGRLAVQTDDGVKVSDAAWMTSDYYGRHEDEGVYQASPEIVVEVRFGLNVCVETRERSRLFFTRGAKEFWIVERDGRVRFFTDVDHEVARSPLCPAFPTLLQPG